MLLGVKNTRKLFDGGIVTVTALSAFLVGYLQSMQFGALTIAIILPNIFLLALSFAHLVLRKGRKFDESVHDRKTQAVEAAVFAALTVSSYFTGLSGELMPENILYLVAAVLSLSVALYLMAYRPNA